MQRGLRSSFWKDFGGSCDAVECDKQFLKSVWEDLGEAVAQWRLSSSFWIAFGKEQ